MGGQRRGCAGLRSPAQCGTPRCARAAWTPAGSGLRSPSRARAAPPLAGRAPRAACRPCRGGPRQQGRLDSGARGLAAAPWVPRRRRCPLHQLLSEAGCAVGPRGGKYATFSRLSSTAHNCCLQSLRPLSAARSLVACQSINDLLQRVAGIVCGRGALPAAAVGRTHDLHLRLPRPAGAGQAKLNSQTRWVATTSSGSPAPGCGSSHAPAGRAPPAVLACTAAAPTLLQSRRGQGSPGPGPPPPPCRAGGPAAQQGAPGMAQMHGRQALRACTHPSHPKAALHDLTCCCPSTTRCLISAWHSGHLGCRRVRHHCFRHS